MTHSDKTHSDETDFEATPQPSNSCKGMTRRSFLRTAAISAGTLVAARFPVSAMTMGSTSAARYALHIPPIASPNSFALTAAPATANLGDGRAASVLAYNGLFPGPTLRASQGSSASVQFANGLSEKTTVHWHGMIVPSDEDGHPKDAVSPGQSYLYQFPIRQRACLNWYHPHPDKITGEQVCLGLAGAFIVNDAEEAAL